MVGEELRCGAEDLMLRKRTEGRRRWRRHHGEGDEAGTPLYPAFLVSYSPSDSDPLPSSSEPRLEKNSAAARRASRCASAPGEGGGGGSFTGKRTRPARPRWVRRRMIDGRDWMWVHMRVEIFHGDKRSFQMAEIFLSWLFSSTFLNFCIFRPDMWALL